MDKLTKRNLRQDAQNRLVNNPQDPLHDVTHHYRTWLIALQLVEAEGLQEQVDLDALELICWWHDVLVIEEELADGERVVDGTTRHVRKIFPDDVKEEAALAISTHEFGTEPKNLLGKILQDSDKLEILSPERIEMAIEAVQAGIWTKEYALRLMESIKTDWLPKMIERYHFQFSRDYHNAKLSEILEYLELVKQRLTDWNIALK